MVLACVAALSVGAPSSAEILPLTDNDADDNHPRIDGPNVVWEGDDGGGDTEIFFFDGATTVPLTDNDQDDANPDVSGSRVVWQTREGIDWDIALNDGVSTILLTNNTPAIEYNASDRNPAIDGDAVVWVGDVGTAGPASTPDEVFYYDGVNTTQHGGFILGSTAISGSNVVWDGDYNVPYEIYLYVGTGYPVKISGSVFSFRPAISGSTVVWHGTIYGDGTDDEIFLYQGGAPIQLTDNEEEDINAAISGANVVWQGWDGHDWEIWFFDGLTAQQITDNETDDEHPDVSGFDVVWEGDDGNDREIYRTTVPEPQTLALGLGALLAIAALRRA